ncbi:MAG: hypothetical protein LBC13_02955 [Clostridiales bacterium]|jgi:hypothetical protein|nr:hypothetical protein [Clostridiales bacterium]
MNVKMQKDQKIKQEIVTEGLGTHGGVTKLFKNTTIETDFALSEAVSLYGCKFNRLTVRFDKQSGIYYAEAGLWLRISGKYIIGKTFKNLSTYDCFNLLKMIGAGIRQTYIRRIFAA